MKPTLDMTQSPLDRKPVGPAEPLLVQLRVKPKQRWVPSRYNARTVGDDGRLILWNTFTGAISIFQPKDRDDILAALSPKGQALPLSKAGQYLEKRGFLVPDTVDEMVQFRYKYAQEQWRTDTLQLHVLSSEDCNFRCVYCYEKFKNGTMRPEVREGIKNLVLQRARYLKLMTISWFGGEPLYGWEAVEELSPFFKKVADEHDIMHGQVMTTNAYLLTEERATKLLEWGCNSYQITIDGLASEHDCKRKGRDGSPTHAVILDNLRSMKQRKDLFQVAIRVNYDRDNFPRLGEFLEALSEDFGGDNRFMLRFRPVGKWGGDNDENLNTCGTGDQRTILLQLRQKTVDVGLRLEAGIKEWNEFGSQVCYAARPYNFIVGATGKLMKCTIALDEMEENVVGQIHPDGSMDLNDVHMTKWVQPYFETDSLCQSCYVLPGCQGSTCPLSRVRRGERTCCAAKSELKREMRYTLDEAARRAAAREAAPEPVLAGV